MDNLNDENKENGLSALDSMAQINTLDFFFSCVVLLFRSCNSYYWAFMNYIYGWGYNFVH